MNKDEIKEAKNKINQIIELGREIQNSATFLIDIRNRLDWMEYIEDVEINNKNEITKYFCEPVKHINDLTISNYSENWASGSDALTSGATYQSADKIKHYGSDYIYLVDKLYQNSNIEDKVDNIRGVLSCISKKALNDFNVAIESKAKWDLNLRSNSELAGEMRTFINSLTGILNNIRIRETENLKKGKTPDFSWNKVYKYIGKNGASYQRAWLSQKTPYEKIVQELTYVFKKKKTVDKNALLITYNEYIDWIFSSVNLIDITKI